MAMIMILIPIIGTRAFSCFGPACSSTSIFVLQCCHRLVKTRIRLVHEQKALFLMLTYLADIDLHDNHLWESLDMTGIHTKLS